ncbi:uncharacterized protein LOC106767527 [Vigna radiata var. radiata]|uniref:Uncharacterized protein LOC106767527 n=1 Tax=Vigna radiata var. radiata TaxID=3916 RepID=A0A1S3UPR9_VIGRR|nr:uncharacterized protein LOC106767527 [Vigna radiata var. radiata]
MAPKKSLWDFMSEVKLVVKPHSRHFHILCLIFLYPVCLSLLLSPTISNLFDYFFIKNSSSLLPPQTINPTFLLYSLFLSLFSNCGIITIIYSVFHFSHNQPVNLPSTIKSISTSFLPLLATTIVSQLIFFFISLFYGLLFILLIHGAKLFHLTVLPHSSPFILGFLILLPIIVVQTYLEVNWILASVIVVVESCWGMEPLRRSAKLIKGMKGVALSCIFFYGFSGLIMVLNLLYLTRGHDGFTESWFAAVLKWVLILLGSYTQAIIMFSRIALITVLYIYCKANNVEIAEEFGKEYVSLPFHDDGKVSQIV